PRELSERNDPGGGDPPFVDVQQQVGASRERDRDPAGWVGQAPERLRDRRRLLEGERHGRRTGRTVKSFPGPTVDHLALWSPERWPPPTDAVRARPAILHTAHPDRRLRRGARRVPPPRRLPAAERRRPRRRRTGRRVARLPADAG